MAQTLRIVAMRPGHSGEEIVRKIFGEMLDDEDITLAVDDVKNETESFSAIFSEDIEFDVILSIVKSSDDPNSVIIEEVDYDIETLEVYDNRHLYPDNDLSITNQSNQETSEDVNDTYSEQPAEETYVSNDYDSPDEDDHLYNYSSLSVDDFDELIPSADAIVRELNPVISDIPMATSPWAVLAMTQQTSMISMLYASLSNEFGSVNIRTLESELLKFKNAIKNQSIYEVSQYLNSKRELKEFRDDVNDQVSTIRASYEIAFNEWLESQIEILKAQYMSEHPDTTEDQVNNLLVQIKPEMDRAELKVEEDKIFAEQAMIREFSKFSKHPELTTAMTFMLAKEQAREALRNAIPTLNAPTPQYEHTQRVLNDEVPTTHQSYSSVEDDDHQMTRFVYEDDDHSDNQSFSYDNDSYEETVVHESPVQEVENLTDILAQMSDEEIKKAYDLIAEGQSLDDVIDLYRSGRLLTFSGQVIETPRVEAQDRIDFDQFYENQQVEEPQSYNEQLTRVDDFSATREVSLDDFNSQPEISSVSPFNDVEATQQFDTTNDFVNYPETAMNIDDTLDLGNTGPIPDVSDLTDFGSQSDQYLGQGSDILNSIDESYDQTDALAMSDEDRLFASDVDNSDYLDDQAQFIMTDGDSSDEFDFVDDEDEDEKPKKSKKSKKSKKPKKSKKSKKDSDSSGQPMSKAKMAIFGAAASAIIAVGGIGGYMLLNGGNDKSNEPKTEQTTQDDNETILKFFERAALVGIDVDQSFTFTDEELGEVSGTITALRSDGSIIVVLEDGSNKTVPYSVVKSAVISLESQQPEATEATGEEGQTEEVTSSETGAEDSAETAESTESTEASESQEESSTEENK